MNRLTAPALFPQEATMESLWNADEVAAYLRCSRSFVYKRAEDGSLPSVRIGAMLRFVPELVRAFALGEAAQGNVVQLDRRSL